MEENTIDEVPKRIPRPPNAFMIYGQQHRKILATQNPSKTNKEVSKLLGDHWKSLDDESKGHYHQLAEKAYTDHMKKHPGYYYSPLEARQRKAERKRKSYQRTSKAYESQENIVYPLHRNIVLSGPDGSQIQILNDNYMNPDEYQEADAFRPEDHIFSTGGQYIPIYCQHGNMVHYTYRAPLGPISMNQPFFLNKVPRYEKVDEESSDSGSHKLDKNIQENEAEHFDENNRAVRLTTKPTIYHVSYKDPNLGSCAQGAQGVPTDGYVGAFNSFPVNSNPEFGGGYPYLLPPMDNPSTITPVGSESSFVNSSDLSKQFEENETPTLISESVKVEVDEETRNELMGSKIEATSTDLNARVIVKREPVSETSSPLAMMKELSEITSSYQ